LTGIAYLTVGRKENLRDKGQEESMNFFLTFTLFSAIIELGQMTPIYNSK